MRKTRIFFSTIAAVLLAMGTAHATAPAVPTIEQLAAFPQYSGFALSPDGQHIAALRANGEDRVIAVWATDALDKAPTLIGAQRVKIRGVSFLKNDRLAVSVWQPFDQAFDVGITKTFLDKTLITDLQGKEWKEPLTPPRAKEKMYQVAQSAFSASIFNSLPNDPYHILAYNNFGSDAGDIYRVDLRDYSAVRIQMAGENVDHYYADLDGNLRARMVRGNDGNGAYVAIEFRDMANVNSQVTVGEGADAKTEKQSVQSLTGNWVEHFRSYAKDRDEIDIASFSTDPNIVYIASNKGQDKSVLYEYDIANRQQKEILFQHKFFDATRVVVNPYRSAGDAFGAILGVGYDGPRGSEVERTYPALRALDAGLKQALGITEQKLSITDPATGQTATIDYPVAKDYGIIGFTPDFSTVLLRVSGSATPAEYYLFRNGRLTLLAKSYQDIDPRVYGNTTLIYYKARDGLDIPAFLTTPNTELCGAGPWNTVVHPHGGPWSRDTMDFDGSMWIPLMASRCMAVLRPQYRGSQGWGRRLWMAGDNEWGQKMQDDKDDGAKWMIDQGIAKPNHIAMFGFSYGGYAAMVAAIRPEGIYKCAIAGAGVSDIKKIWARFYTNPYYRQGQEPTVSGLNPVDHADQIKIPIMVYQGERDRTVPIEQAQWFVAKAKNSGQPVEYHELADFAHGPAWTRAIDAQQLRYIENYFSSGCGGLGL